MAGAHSSRAILSIATLFSRPRPACLSTRARAAFATNSPKIGVGTTLGAGIFVTCAVIAVVSFVADVRLARRPFVRDIVFFIITIVYLLAVSLDGFITLWESIGFMIIYIVFLAVRALSRLTTYLAANEMDLLVEPRDRAAPARARQSRCEAPPAWRKRWRRRRWQKARQRQRQRRQ